MNGLKLVCCPFTLFGIKGEGGRGVSRTQFAILLKGEVENRPKSWALAHRHWQVFEGGLEGFPGAILNRSGQFFIPYSPS